jgi:stearoyl-CoA desaturase (delta-9 desaturase)
MTRLERNVNIAAVVLPLAGVVLAGVLLWNQFLNARDLAIFAAMYLLTDASMKSRARFRAS